MKTKTPRGSQVLWIAVMIGFALAILLVTASTGSAQTLWTVSPSPTPTNNIYYNAGNVGIGTNAPDQKLVVSTNSATTLPASVGIINLFGANSSQASIGIDGFAAQAGLLVRRANTTAASPSALQANNLIGLFGAAGFGTTGYVGTRARVGFFASENWTDTANGTYIAFNTTANGAATSGGTERMRIDNAGNVGIGTGNPGRQLEISNWNAGLDTQLRLYHQNGDAGNSLGSTEIEFLHGGNQLATSKLRVVRGFNQNGSSNTDFSLDLVKGNASDNGNSTNTVMFAQGLTGYVGIGTSTPSSRLHLFSGGTSDNVLQSFQNGTRNWTVGINGASDFFRITDQTAVVARLAIMNNGNVGIGTTTPGATYKLDVAGTVNASGFKVDGSPITSSQWNSNGTAINYVSGNVGIGTGMSAPSYALDVAGDIHSTTGVRFPDGNLQSTAVQGSFKYLADSGATTRITANSNNGTLQFVGAGGTTITFDDQAKRVTIDGSTSTVTASNVSPGQFATGNYTFPGNVTVTGTIEGGNIRAKFQDMAEWVPSSEQLPTGTVVVLDTTKSNRVISSSEAYDTRVAGVVSEQPGIALGEGGQGKVLVATTGRVLVKVDATNNPIHIGDILVTSDIPGFAMKSVPITIGNRKIHTPGTLIGKALEPLEKGSGKILVLLSLQ